MLSQQLHDAIRAFLSSTTERCLLIVGTEIDQLSEQARVLQQQYAWPQLKVGPELSDMLLTVAPRQRPQRARDGLVALLPTCAQDPPAPVLCTHIDLLFEPALKLDPLRLFCYLGKTTPLVVCWPGKYCDAVLSYAAPDHAHYHVWRNPDVPIVPLD